MRFEANEARGDRRERETNVSMLTVADDGVSVVSVGDDGSLQREGRKLESASSSTAEQEKRRRKEEKKTRLTPCRP